MAAHSSPTSYALAVKVAEGYWLLNDYTYFDLRWFSITLVIYGTYVYESIIYAKSLTYG